VNCFIVLRGGSLTCRAHFLWDLMISTIRRV